MQLSEKPKTIYQYFIAFQESTLHFEKKKKKKRKKKEPYSSSISEVIDSERYAYLTA